MAEEKIIMQLLSNGPLRDFDIDTTELVAISFIEEISELKPLAVEDHEKIVNLFTELIEGFVGDVGDLPNKHWVDDINDLVTDLMDEYPEILTKTESVAEEHLVGDACIALLDEDNLWHLAILAGVVEDDEEKWIVKFLDFSNLRRSVLKENVKFPESLTKEALAEYGLDANETYDTSSGNGICLMCKRNGLPITIHHMIPKSEHGKSNKSHAWLNGKENLLKCCRPCHSAIHRSEPNSVLAKDYYTLELIMKHPKIQSFVNWVKSQTTKGYLSSHANRRKAKNG
jgi:hypothetical protein